MTRQAPAGRRPVKHGSRPAHRRFLSKSKNGPADTLALSHRLIGKASRPGVRSGKSSGFTRSRPASSSSLPHGAGAVRVSHTTAPVMGAVSSEVASMIAAVNAPCFIPTIEELQVRFRGILGRIEQHAKITFRHVTCREKRADLVAETVGLAWKWFVRIAERGKDARLFPRHWPRSLPRLSAAAGACAA